MRVLIVTLLALALVGCTGRPSLEGEKLSDRQLNLEEFFAGESVAHGQFQDRFGNVSRRFTVDIVGTWDGRLLTLAEDFVYEDGSTEQRVWSLTKTGPDSWVGTAPGVIGQAVGQENGDTFNWQYTIDLPLPDASAPPGTPPETLRVTFDDWMWLLTEDRLLNRAYMRKFGVTIGEVIISFEKR
jgi:hypothetical protein